MCTHLRACACLHHRLAISDRIDDRAGVGVGEREGGQRLPFVWVGAGLAARALEVLAPGRLPLLGLPGSGYILYYPWF